MARKIATALAIATASCAAPTEPAPPPPPSSAPPAPPQTVAPEPVTTTATVPTTAPPTTAATSPPAVASVPPPTSAGRAEPVVGAGADVQEGGGDVEGTGQDVVAAICAAWGDECARAVRVARCESGLRPGARNGSHAGLFQIATRVHAARIARMSYTTAQMFEVGPNIAVAHALWAEQGWRPWTCAA